MGIKKQNIIYLIVLLFSIFIISVCGVLLFNLSKSETNILGSTIIYTTQSESIVSDILNEGTLEKLPENSTDINSFIDSLSLKSIKELDGLNIEVNIPENYISIKKKSNSDILIENVYKNLLNELSKNRDIYLPLLSQLSYDSDNNLMNVFYDSNSDEIRIQGINNEQIDARFLGVNYSTLDDLSNPSSKNISGDLGLFDFSLEDYENDSILGYVFKPECVYGQSCTDVGETALGLVTSNVGSIWMDCSKSGVYQFIDYSSILNTLKVNEIKEGSIKEIEISSLNTSYNATDLRVYIENDALIYESVICELFESFGYRIEKVEEKETSDLIIGYTWIYSDSFQSSLDSNLNDAIKNYYLGKGETDNIKFIFRSSWELKKIQGV